MIGAGTVHDPHKGKGTVLHDGCSRCWEHAETLTSLDDSHLQRLTGLAYGVRSGGIPIDDLADVERYAIERLRTWGRVVHMAGMTRELAS